MKNMGGIDRIVRAIVGIGLLILAFWVVTGALQIVFWVLAGILLVTALVNNPTVSYGAIRGKGANPQDSGLGHFHPTSKLTGIWWSFLSK
jgi:fatty acid desaturase